MLIGLKKRFIFIASTKSASTSIESALRPYVEIALINRFKHMPAQSVKRNFGFLFNEVRGGRFQDFYRFGIVRDPVDWVISWYNYRSRPEIAGKSNRYVGNLTFEDFWRQWPKYGLGSPTRCFCDSRGQSLMSELVPFWRLAERFPAIIGALGIEPAPRLQQENRSKFIRLRRGDIDPQIEAQIRDFFAADYRFIERECSVSIEPTQQRVPRQLSTRIRSGANSRVSNARKNPVSSKNVDLAKKIAFVHIPKTGGSTVEQHFFGQYESSAHRAASFYRKNYAGFFLFTFVRNPYTRFLSAYFYYLNGGNKTKSDLRKMKRLEALGPDIEGVCLQASVFLGWSHFLPQSHYANDILDFIGRYESFRRDLALLAEKFNVSVTQRADRVNVYPEFEVTPSFVEFINTKYEIDFERFAYPKIKLDVAIPYAEFLGILDE